MTTKTYIQRSRTYILRDAPDESAPLKRIQKEGADVVKIKNLLQIALGRIESIDTYLREYGVQSLTHLQRVDEIKEQLSLDDVQATRLLAILGLGKRLYSANHDTLPVVRGIEDVFSHYRGMGNLAKEHLRVVLLNSRYQITHDELIAIGNSEWLRASPKDLLQSAVARQATAIILIHNHPSGNPTPSQADYMFTEQMQKAANLMGIEILDHVIVTQHEYASCLPVSSQES